MSHGVGVVLKVVVVVVLVVVLFTVVVLVAALTHVRCKVLTILLTSTFILINNNIKRTFQKIIREEDSNEAWY